MKSARDQGIATGVISLGLLANKLTWYLLGGNKELPALKVDKNVFEQWKAVLRETIDFIQSLETGNKAKQTGGVPRFLSRAQYLEQIYIAAPIEKKDMKALSEYLETIFRYLEDLDKGKRVNEGKQEKLLAFSNSITNESIQQAARFHQETHVRTKLEPQAEITSGA